MSVYLWDDCSIFKLAISLTFSVNMSSTFAGYSDIIGPLWELAWDPVGSSCKVFRTFQIPRGKSLWESWGTTFLPNWQPPLIFNWRNWRNKSGISVTATFCRQAAVRLNGAALYFYRLVLLWTELHKYSCVYEVFWRNNKSTGVPFKLF